MLRWEELNAEKEEDNLWQMIPSSSGSHCVFFKNVKHKTYLTLLERDGHPFHTSSPKNYDNGIEWNIKYANNIQQNPNYYNSSISRKSKEVERAECRLL